MRKHVSDPEDTWTDEKNARRCVLIDKDVDKTITPEEKEELATLQAEEKKHLDRVAPLNLDTPRILVRSILEKLIAEGIADSDQIREHALLGKALNRTITGAEEEELAALTVLQNKKNYDG